MTLLCLIRHDWKPRVKVGRVTTDPGHLKPIPANAILLGPRLSKDGLDYITQTGRQCRRCGRIKRCDPT